MKLKDFLNRFMFLGVIILTYCYLWGIYIMCYEFSYPAPCVSKYGPWTKMSLTPLVYRFCWFLNSCGNRKWLRKKDQTLHSTIAPKSNLFLHGGSYFAVQGLIFFPLIFYFDLSMHLRLSGCAQLPHFHDRTWHACQQIIPTEDFLTFV